MNSMKTCLQLISITDDYKIPDRLSKSISGKAINAFQLHISWMKSPSLMSFVACANIQFFAIQPIPAGALLVFKKFAWSESLTGLT